MPRRNLSPEREAELDALLTSGDLDKENADDLKTSFSLAQQVVAACEGQHPLHIWLATSYVAKRSMQLMEDEARRKGSADLKRAISDLKARFIATLMTGGPEDERPRRTG